MISEQDLNGDGNMPGAFPGHEDAAAEQPQASLPFEEQEPLSPHNTVDDYDASGAHLVAQLSEDEGTDFEPYLPGPEGGGARESSTPQDGILSDLLVDKSDFKLQQPPAYSSHLIETKKLPRGRFSEGREGREIQRLAMNKKGNKKRRLAGKRPRSHKIGSRPNTPPVDSQMPNLATTDQLQYLIMSQMMSQQMAAQQMATQHMAVQQMQMAQIASVNNHRPHRGRQDHQECSNTAIQVQNCPNGRSARKPIRRLGSRSIAITPANVNVRNAPVARTLPVPASNPSVDNWQEITVILVIAIIGLIYLVCSRSPSSNEEKKPSAAAKYLT